MGKKNILVTGITGFIGANVAEGLILNGYNVIGLKRITSNIERIINVKDKITWVDITDNFELEIIDLKPAIIIHCAWEGVQAKDRTNHEIQTRNLIFLDKILNIAKALKVVKLIALGSQAEYGYLDSLVSEDKELAPVTLYGELKVLALTRLSSFCATNRIKWYWLRVFSIYGEKEDKHWFITLLIEKFLNAKSYINLSSCDQEYAYLYIKDFVAYILLFIETESAECGIYNVSGNKLLSLKTIVEKIKVLTNNSLTKINFDEKLNRTNQSRILIGNIAKMEKNIGLIAQTKIEDGLKATINFFKSNNYESN